MVSSFCAFFFLNSKRLNHGQFASETCRAILLYKENENTTVLDLLLNETYFDISFTSFGC